MQPSTQYAGFWKRFAALVIDALVLLVPYLIIWAIFRNQAPIRTVLNILMGWAYGAGMESSTRQATVGKMVMGIVVTDINGNRLSFGRATGRYFGKILSGLIIGIGYIIAAFTAKKQALPDLLAETLVVVKQPSTAMPPSMMPPAGTGPSH